jgi:hypothetical protein
MDFNNQGIIMESLQALPELMPNQKLVETKLVAASEKIMSDIIEIVNNCINYSKNKDMQGLFGLVKQVNMPLPKIDDRTQKLFNQMIIKINDALEKDQSFNAVCNLMRNMVPDFRKKLIETTALPTIKQLVVSLDVLNPEYVNQVINS